MSSISQEELKLLIDQTYRVEEEFNALKSSYDNLSESVKEIVEFLPNAIWILNQDETVFLQNSQAKALGELLMELKLKNNDCEVQFDGKSYLMKKSLYKERIMISATDITEQKKKENLATMGQMAAHLSHEIRNPIGSIALLSSTLKKRVMEKNIPLVEEIQKAVFKIERIIKSTLMFSKGISANKERFLWSELLSSLKLSIGYYGYTKEIKFVFFEQEVEINGDRDLLEMLFLNLLINAIDAIELDDNENGEVEVAYERRGSSHFFRVYDSGVSVEDEDKLFEAFSSTKVKGNGLGLVLCSQIAKAHGGGVAYANEQKKYFEIELIV